MKLLSVERDNIRGWPKRSSIWISDGSILTPWANSTSAVLAVLAVDGTIHIPDSHYLRQSDQKLPASLADAARCAGIIEATDQEMQILADAGYRLTDLRNVGVRELLTAALE